MDISGGHCPVIASCMYCESACKTNCAVIRSHSWHGFCDLPRHVPAQQCDQLSREAVRIQPDGSVWVTDERTEYLEAVHFPYRRLRLRSEGPSTHCHSQLQQCEF